MQRRSPAERVLGGERASRRSAVPLGEAEGPGGPGGVDRRVPLPPRALQVVGAWGWRLLVGAAALYLVVIALATLYVLVVPVLLALFLAAVLEPEVERLRNRGFHSGIAAAIVFVVALVVVVVIAVFIANSVSGQFAQLGQSVGAGTQQLEDWLVNGPLQLPEDAVIDLQRQVLATFQSGAGSAGLVQRVLGQAYVLIEVVGALLLMLFTLFFLLKDGQEIGAWLTERVPPSYRDDLTAISSRARLVMRRYLLGAAATGLIDASLIGTALVAVGVPLVVPLVILTFFGAFFPVVGATTAGAISALVALVSGGPADAALVVLAALVVEQLEGNVLQPLIMERAVALHPIVSVWAVTAGLVLGGLVGAFLAVPLTALVARVAHYYRTRDTTPTPAPT